MNRLLPTLLVAALLVPGLSARAAGGSPFLARALDAIANGINSVASSLTPTDQSSEPSPPQPTVKMDRQSRIILTAVARKMKRTRYLTADFVDIQHAYVPSKKKWRGPNMIDGSIVLAKPNFSLVHSWWVSHKKGVRGAVKYLESYDYDDGKTYTSYWDLANKTYSQDPSGQTPRMMWVEQLEPFFQNDLNADAVVGYGWSNAQRSIRYIGTGTWRGARYRIVEMKGVATDTDTTFDITIQAFIGSDYLPHRFISHTVMTGAEFNGAVQNWDLQFTDLQTPKSIPLSTFAFTPPKAGTEKEQFDFSAAAQKSVLAKGASAPDFTVYDPTGKPVKLSDYAGKVVVLDFWATWCGPCQMSLPITSQVAKAYAGKNVTVLAINTWDTKSAFDDWLPQHKQMSAIKFAIDTSPQGKDIAGTLYNVTGIPTQFVIDPSGKVAWSNVGYDDSPRPLEAAIDAALAAAPQPTTAPVGSPAPAPSTGQSPEIDAAGSK